MRVLYDGAIFESTQRGGIARYFTEVINRLPAAVHPILIGSEDQLADMTHRNFVHHKIRARPPAKLFKGLWRAAQGRHAARLLQQENGSLIHWTYYQGLCRQPIRSLSVPSVITIYDFIHEAFPEMEPSGVTRAMKQRAIELASHICCISQTTFHELCERFPEAANRASVTPLGSSLTAGEAAPLPNSLVERPFLLFVGRRDHYKNFAVLWDAWNNIQKRAPELELVVVGPPMDSAERARLGANCESSRLHLIPNAPDSLLKALYQNCEAFVFPSRMEGFGLPILEAMSNNAPVLASSCSAFREVAADAGHYFDPEDVDSLADLLYCISQQSLADREEKVIAGHRRVAFYTWEKTAEQTMDAYRQVVQTPAQRRPA
ncbi:glycosyltransferase family 4 protein [Allorhodopirellula solitaria]|uniref:GDP-mannose-dependent alpha-(1-2)-phosphatidylinositol mannosyltransferase n=1 Tax=Allorhodopirellula solitaria TaxID=2527987 RepID=A0A5C5X2A3_9BACT|nr:glycosyltransferase family 1 protein [Allorhodopirellula solitaria]TWT56362.1 GDP-mannose-dependent alpha-(1-2)-phosphatidylinositol mannosyltransferase [Allorhodopirellula solitaria]